MTKAHGKFFVSFLLSDIMLFGNKDLFQQINFIEEYVLEEYVLYKSINQQHNR